MIATANGPVREEVLPMPRRMESRPVERGYPVPWFVADMDGVYDFRVIRPDGFKDAHTNRRCWVCGQSLGAYKAFVLGPMCAVNRVSAEPPSHRECAEWSARVCPFLARPHARRRDHNYPEDATVPAGEMITRNPGVALVWISKSYRVRKDPRPNMGYLIDLDDPVETLWYAKGRAATREEVDASIDSGLPILQEAAASDGPAAERALQKALDAAMPLLPA